MFYDVVQENVIDVIGYGPIKVGRETYMGGGMYHLYDHLKWKEFNERVILPTTGYVLSSKWPNWENFLRDTKKDDVWAFVGKLIKEDKLKLKPLSRVASTVTIADIDARVRHLAK